jgi:hypothetical protein
VRLKVKEVDRGMHPNEVVVSVETAEGQSENLVVHRRSLSEDSSLEIGYPINREGETYLVELPRETMTGAWRVWVPTGAVFSS